MADTKEDRFTVRLDATDRKRLAALSKRYAERLKASDVGRKSVSKREVIALVLRDAARYHGLEAAPPGSVLAPDVEPNGAGVR